MAGDGNLWPAVAAAGNAISGALTNRAAVRVSKRNVDKTIKAQRAEAEKAYQRQVEMWNMQNQYNTPEAQMNRYKNAGLNPHLIYGQGTPGNANSFPEYQAPNIQYQYEAPNYGPIGDVVPTLMSVGTWMQNMRLSEAEIKSKELGQEKVLADTERVRQLVGYLEQVNPKLFQQVSNKTFMQDYQLQGMQLSNAKVAQAIAEMRQEYRYRYGEELFQELPTSDLYSPGKFSTQGGIRKVQFLQEEAKRKLLEAKSSWTEYGVTDPQMLVQMVLAGVMGMAGMQLRAATGKKAPVRRERPRGLNRRRMGPNHPDR